MKINVPTQENPKQKKCVEENGIEKVEDGTPSYGGEIQRHREAR